MSGARHNPIDVGNSSILINDDEEIRQVQILTQQLLNPPLDASHVLPRTWLYQIAPEHFDGRGRLRKDSVLFHLSPSALGIKLEFYAWMKGVAFDVFDARFRLPPLEYFQQGGGYA